VNILSYEGGRGQTSAESSTATTANSDPLFVPYQLGDIAMNIAPAEEMEYGKTAVDALDVGFLAEKNLYLDVVRSTEDDCVDFGIKCDGELMDEGMVRSFAGEIAGEVEKIVEVIGRKEV